MAKYLLEFTGKTCNENWISLGKREQKTGHSQRPFILAFILLVCKFMGGRVWSEEGRRQDKVVGKKPIKNYKRFFILCSGWSIHFYYDVTVHI